MGLRAGFQDRYFVETSKGTLAEAISTSIPDFGAGSIGLDADKYLIYLNNKPNLAPNPKMIKDKKATGKSYRITSNGGEFHVGTFSPTTTVEFDGNAKTLGLFLWLLFQSGASESSTTPYPKRYIPYSSSVAEVYISILRDLGDETSHAIDGALVKSMTISAEEGGALKVSCEMLGAAYRSSVDTTPSGISISTTAITDAPLFYQNATTILAYNGTAGTDVGLVGFSITITNNAVMRHYASQTGSKFILGDLEVTGSIKIPRDTTNYVDNAAIDDWLDTSNGVGVDRQLLIMFDAIGSGVDTLDVGEPAGEASISVADESGFVDDDIVIIEDGETTQEFGVAQAVISGNITLKNGLSFTQPNGADIVTAATNFLGIRLNIKYDSINTGGDDEIVSEVNFECVSDGTYEAIEIALADTVDRII